MKLYCLVLVCMSLLCISCKKSLDKPIAIETKTMLQPQQLLHNLDSAILTVNIVPVVVCYSYTNGDMPRPCEVFVEIRCTLSRPIRALLRVEFEGSGKIFASREAMMPMKIGCAIAPGVLVFSFRKILADNSSPYIPDKYNISNVSVYNMIH